jgi:hypothetical protein
MRSSSQQQVFSTLSFGFVTYGLLMLVMARYGRIASGRAF